MNQNPLDFKPQNGYGCIYCYLVDGKYYIGQTYTTMKRRHSKHLCEDLLIDRKLRTYDYNLRILQIDKIEYLDILERNFILEFNSKYPNGWSLSDGGTPYGYNSMQNKNQIREEMSIKFSGSGNPMYGKCGELSPSFGRKWSEEMKKQISESNIGKHENSPAQRQVQQYDLNGNYIATYISTMDAYRKTGVDYQCISKVALGKRKQAKGFVWKYV